MELWEDETLSYIDRVFWNSNLVPFRLQPNVLCYTSGLSGHTISLMGEPFNLQGEGWSIFEMNNFGQTIHEINNLLQELFYVNIK